MPANSSMALRRAMMTFFCARRREPTASVEVHTTSMAMGMEATRMTITMERFFMTVGLPCVKNCNLTKMMAAMMRHSTSRMRVMLKRIFWKRPWLSTLAMRPAALPKKVFAPVATTTALLSPRLMAEPILSLSPGWMLTGRLSPVSADWSTCICMPGSSVASAGTTSPSLISTRSPGTSSRAWMLFHSPSRHTWHCGASCALSAAMASPALRSSM